MTLPVTDSSGVALGAFTIPTGVKTGTKLVRFLGGFGSIADAYYTGSGEVIPTRPKPISMGDTSANTRKGVAITVSAANGLLANCSTPNGGQLVVSGNSTPTSGSVVVSTDGSFIYTPTSIFVGLASFEFSCTDGSGQVGAGMAFIMVLDEPLPPIAVDDNWATALNRSVTNNVISNDSSPDGRPLHLISNTSPAHGAVTTAPGGAVTYTPATGYSGVDSFTYTISDDRGLTASATVWVHIDTMELKAVNDEFDLNKLLGHRFESYLHIGGMHVSASLDVLANDMVPNGTVIIAVTQPPDHGSIYSSVVSIAAGGGSLNYVATAISYGPGIFSYTPNDTFTYTIQSPDGAQATATVHVFGNANYVDPLAETFSFDSARQIHGVDVWVATKGSGPLSIEARNVVSGIPDQQPLTRGSIALADMVEGAWNRILFAVPFLAIENKNYAFVAMCDDATTELATAEIGQYDLAAHEWVTSQPYSIGVMLTSSNNATWTPHQNTDLTFRLLSKAYSVTTKRVTLGTVSLAGDTDFVVNATVSIPSPQCSVSFELAMPGGGGTYTVLASQPLALTSAQTGTMTVTAVLVGTANFTPILGQDVAVLHGAIGATGSYMSRSMPLPGGTGTVRCIYEALLPAGSSVSAAVTKSIVGRSASPWSSSTAYVAGDVVSLSGADYYCILGHTNHTPPNVTYWSPMTDVAMGAPTATAVLDNGYVENTHQVAVTAADAVQVGLVLSGSAAARPVIKNFRAMVM